MVVEIQNSNFFKNRSTREVQDKDLNRGIKRFLFIRGSVLFDPNQKIDGNFSQNDILEIINRKPFIKNDGNYLKLCRALNRQAHDQDKFKGQEESEDPFDESIIAFFVAKAFPVRNGDASFSGARRVLVVSPIVIDGDKFKGYKKLLPYFLLEQKIILARVLPILFRLGSVDDSDWKKIRQIAKEIVIRTALYKGVLEPYLALHDLLYPGNSDNPNVIKQFEIRELAEANVAAEYTSSLSKISNALLNIACEGNPEPSEIYKKLRKVQEKQGFKPLRFKKSSSKDKR